VRTQRLIVIAAAFLFATTADAASLFGTYSNIRLDHSNVSGLGIGGEWPLAGPLDLTVEGTRQAGLARGEDLAEVAVLAGPRFTFRRGRRFVPFLHGKAGLVRSRRQVKIFGLAIGPDGVCNGSCPSETGVAFEAGGGFDLRLDEKWGIRLVQIDYRFTNLVTDESARQRVSAGLVYAWGR